MAQVVFEEKKLFEGLKACICTPYQYYNLKNSLIVVCFLFFVKFLSIFRSIFKQSAWASSPVLENKENFWRTFDASRRSDFPVLSIGFFSKPSLTSNTSSSPSLILPVLKNSANISGSVSGGCTAETSASTSFNKTALTSSGTRSGLRFGKASVSFCKSLNGWSSSTIAAS